MIRVTVWNEGRHEKVIPQMQELYPLGLHGTVQQFLQTDEELSVRTATLDEPECGLPDEVLNTTDVLMWWGHCAHAEVPDELVNKLADRVLRGMGLIMMHSGHCSKLFQKLMGTSCSLRWRDNDYERVWCTNPGHPIAAGIPPYFELECEEMYGEFFDVPQPDELVFTGWFRGGEVFRSGCCWYRGAGKIFYFQPGHETNASFHNPYVQRILRNAVHWAAPVCWRGSTECRNAHVSAEERAAEGLPAETY